MLPLEFGPEGLRNRCLNLRLFPSLTNFKCQLQAAPYPTLIAHHRRNPSVARAWRPIFSPRKEQKHPRWIKSVQEMLDQPVRWSRTGRIRVDAAWCQVDKNGCVRFVWRPNMKFLLVNGRRPRSQSCCANHLCCEPVGENYLRELATHFTYCDYKCYADQCKFRVKALRAARQPQDNVEASKRLGSATLSIVRHSVVVGANRTSRRSQNGA